MLDGVDKGDQQDEISRRLPFIPPDIEYLIGWLMELGIAGKGAMGPTALPFTEIDAWARLNAITLDAWELKALRAMSIGYVNEIASDNDALEPMMQVEVPAEEVAMAKNAEIGRGLERMFRAMEVQQEAELKRRAMKERVPP